LGIVGAVVAHASLRVFLWGSPCAPARGVLALQLGDSLPVGIVGEGATFIQAPALTLMSEALSTLTASTRKDCVLVKFPLRLCRPFGQVPLRSGRGSRRAPSNPGQSPIAGKLVALSPLDRPDR
jgi:hypothetical protein